MPNNFKDQKTIDASGYHLYVRYKPEYASKRTTRPDGSKYFHCFKKRGGGWDTDGLLRRIVYRQGHEYTDALLFSKATGKCIRKWSENAQEQSAHEVEQWNLKQEQKRLKP